MDMRRRPAATRLVAPRSRRLAVAAIALGIAASCGPAESVSAESGAAEIAAESVAAESGAAESGAAEIAAAEAPAGSPVTDSDPVDVAPEVLADELRTAAVQALELPDPVITVEPNAAGEVALVMANSWETVDLTIRSVEDTPTEVVVFASPVRTEWQLGDGNELRCNESGNLDGAGECVHTYPEHGRFEGGMELVWGLSWSLDGEHQGLFETTSTAASFVVTR